MELKLPVSIGSKHDLIRVQREIEQLTESYLQHDIASKQAQQERNIPPASTMLNELLKLNGLKISTDVLQQLPQKLEAIHQYAPRIRVAFASEPTEAIYHKVVSWFRQEINASVLVQVGVQPSIGGGCVVQTHSNRYDFSLRRRLFEQSPLLIKVMNRVK